MVRPPTVRCVFMVVHKSHTLNLLETRPVTGDGRRSDGLGRVVFDYPMVLIGELFFRSRRWQRTTMRYHATGEHAHEKRSTAQ